MKKLLFSLLIATVIVTGCGKEKTDGENNNDSKPVDIITKSERLVCSQKVQTVDVDMIADFKGDVLTYLGLKYEMDLGSYNDAQINAIKAQDMCTTVKQSMASYTEAFTNCKQDVVNKVLVITADFDLDKLITGDIKKEAKIEDIKASLEKQNYVCTINK